MRKITIPVACALLSSIVASGAFAQGPTPQPLLVKSSGSGFVMPDYARDESCEVFANHVLITKNFGRGDAGFRTTERRAITISPGIRQAITKAAAEKVETHGPIPCDGPSTEVRAGTTILFSSGGCGTDQQERKGSASMMLREFVDQFCPKTHSWGGEASPNPHPAR